MSFFSYSGRDPRDFDPSERERIAAFEPPPDELPALLPIGARFAATDHVAIAVVSVRVFSDGIEFQIARYVRRGSLSRRDFSELAQFDPAARDDETLEGQLRFGVELSTGQKITNWSNVDPSSGPLGQTHYSLSDTGRSGSGTDDRYEWADNLWLHPLPPPGPIDFVTQWPAAGI